MRRNKEFFLRRIGDTVYLKASNGNEWKMVFLNETSAFLWEKMDDCSKEEELVKALMEEYDVQEKAALRDVSAFLSFLLENGCLEQEKSS